MPDNEAVSLPGSTKTTWMIQMVSVSVLQCSRDDTQLFNGATDENIKLKSSSRFSSKCMFITSKLIINGLDAQIKKKIKLS